jgi:hypothetical protein
MPDVTCPFVVRTDASGEGIGCLLLQERDGKEVIIECASRKFTDTEKRYPTIEQEAYALMFAIEHWVHYLQGQRFTLETDHRPLVWLQGKRESRGKLGRWALRLTEFDFEVKYIKGESNSADSLSRAFVNMVTAAEFQGAQMNDPHLAEAQRKGGMHRIKDTLFYVDGPGGKHRLCVPEAFKKQVWTSLHEQMGHLGQAKMRTLATERFYWPKMRDDIRRWAKACRVCAVNKDFLPQPAPAPMVEVDSSCLDVMEKISVDVMGPFPEAESGEKYIVVSYDYFSKWLDATPVKVLGGSTMTRWLKEHCSRYGVPREVVLDRGSDMESKEFKEYCRNLGVELRFTAPYHHQSNAVERANRSILNVLRSCLNGGEPREWIDHIPTALLACRAAPHSSTGQSPFELMHGRTPKLPVDFSFPVQPTPAPVSSEALRERFRTVRAAVRGKLKAAAARGKSTYDRARQTQERTFYAGQRVFWKAATPGKLGVVWAGPFVVVAQDSEVNYSIKGQGPVIKKVHINQLKAAYDDEAPLGVLRGRGRPRLNP